MLVAELFLFLVIIIMIACIIMFFVSLLCFDEGAWALVFAFTGVLLIIPATCTTLIMDNLTEQDVTVLQDNKVVTTYKNVHCVSENDNTYTFTNRDGDDFTIVVNGNKSIKQSNYHEYK